MKPVAGAIKGADAGRHIRSPNAGIGADRDTDRPGQGRMEREILKTPRDSVWTNRLIGSHCLSQLEL
jgi:hypothetical protein